MNTPTTDDREIRTRRGLPFPRAQVWAAFADPARLARWWGPQGFTNEVQACDLRPGGEWRFTMVGPDGTRYPNTATFVELRAPERFALRHTVAPLFDATFELSDAATPGHTDLDWRMVFDDARVRAGLAHIIGPANEENLDRLEAELRRGG